MNNNHQQNQKGYVALLIVILVGAISLSISVALLLYGVSTTKNSLAELQSIQAKAAVNACGEVALENIIASSTYTGTGTLALGQEGCTYKVTNPIASTAQIDATGTVGTIVRKIKSSIKISTTPISFSSWQEVP